MTIPALMNCGHSDDGWCLSCTSAMWHELEDLRAKRDRLLELIEDHFDGGEGLWLMFGKDEMGDTEYAIASEYARQVIEANQNRS